jgi:DNA-binding beta-propeller fold protein YncE
MRRMTTATFAIGLLLALAAPAQATDGAFSRVIGRNVNPSGSGGSTTVCTVAASCAAGETGVAGDAFALPAGVATDAAGNIWVADSNNNRIQKLDPSGKFLFALGKGVDNGSSGTCTLAPQCSAAAVGTLDGQFNDPRAVATDAAGDVYVADFLNNRVQKFDSSGKFLLDIGVGFLDLPQGVATDAAGDLLVGEERSNRVSEFDPTGGFVRALGKDVVKGGGTGFEVCTVAASCKEGLQGQLGGEFTEPSGVAFDSAGDMYVVDADSNRVEKFDATGAFLLAYGKDVDSTQPGTGPEVCMVAASCKAGASGDRPGEFFAPAGLATDAAGSVYVGDSLNSRVEKFDASGALQRVIGSGGGAGGLGGQLNDPGSVFVDGAGDLFAADVGNHRIEEFADPLPGGGGGGGGGGMGPPPSKPPRITNLRQSHAKWRVGGRRRPVGTTFSFTLDQKASVKLAFALRGRKRNVATLVRNAHSGFDRIAFRGRLSKTGTLRAGRYTVTFTATNGARRRSASRSLSFTIVR